MASAVIGKVVSKKSQPSKADKKAKEKPAKKVEQKEGKPKTWNEGFRAGSIGRLIADLIVEGKLSNEEILAKVKTDKKSETTLACISWYKSKARKAGVIE